MKINPVKYLFLNLQIQSIKIILLALQKFTNVIKHLCESIFRTFKFYLQINDINFSIFAHPTIGLNFEHVFLIMVQFSDFDYFERTYKRNLIYVNVCKPQQTAKR